MSELKTRVDSLESGFHALDDSQKLHHKRNSEAIRKLQQAVSLILDELKIPQAKEEEIRRLI